jgi:hypothetical protein
MGSSLSVSNESGPPTAGFGSWDGYELLPLSGRVRRLLRFLRLSPPPSRSLRANTSTSSPSQSNSFG